MTSRGGILRCTLRRRFLDTTLKRSLSCGQLQITFILYGAVAVGVTAAVRCPGPRTGSIRVTVTDDQRIHAAGPVDRHTLAPSVLMQTTAA